MNKSVTHIPAKPVHHPKRCALSRPTCAVREQHSRTGSSSHQTSSECQAGLPRIPGGSANDSRLRSSPHDPEGASSMGSRRGSCSSDSVHRQPLRLGGLRTHDRRSATNMSAFETCNTTLEVDLVYLIEDRHHGLLDYFVFHRRDAQRTLPSVSLRYIDSP